MTTPRAILLGLLAMAITCFIIAWSIKPARAETCITPSDMATYILSSSPHAQVRDLHGDAAKKVLDAYNAIGVPTEFAAEEILTVTDNGHKMALIIMFKDGCVSDLPLTLRRDEFDKIGGPGL